MIAQVVFDLPIDGPFDYLVPESLVSSVAIGMRVKVSFGPRSQLGFVTGLLEKSAVVKLKPIVSLGDASVVFNHFDLLFARDFCAYYGCSLGEALGTMLRNKKDLKPSVHRDHKPSFSLFRFPADTYAAKIKEIINAHDRSAKGGRFLILVPDAFRGQMLSPTLSLMEKDMILKIGTRSSVFECDGQYDCVIMVDDEDFSYKQEQTPMYETRQVLLMRAKNFGFDVAFVGISPSVELMALVREGKVKYSEKPPSSLLSMRTVDLSNYKFIPGLISPPVRDALDAALKAGKKSILVLNRRGSYRLTRCVDCAEVLKCVHCASPLAYSKSAGEYLCRHCTYSAPGDVLCPNCHKPSWRSMGIGVEQVQSELKKIFPQAKIVSFERTGPVKRRTGIVRAGEASQSLPDFDILISTQAVLRFQGTLMVAMAAFIDFDAEINRLDMRSAFNAFSLALHVSSMVTKEMFLQTRNGGHYVLHNLSSGMTQGFYDEEIRLRRELGFSPFQHWVKITCRGKLEKSTQDYAQHVYNELMKTSTQEGYAITPPLADAVGRKRGQFRFNLMVQAALVAPAVAFIKSSMAQLKRRRGVIVTLNIDP